MMKRAILIFAVAALALGAEGAEKWKLQLQAQLRDQQQCELLYVTNQRSLELGGEKTVSGRAHCQDGRGFDFSRLKAEQPFALAACEIQAC